MLFVVSVFLLVCATNVLETVHCTFSNSEEANMPVDIRDAADNVSHYNRSRMSSEDTKTTDTENRGRAFTMSDLGVRLMTIAKYNKYAKKVRQYINLKDALKSSEMEALYNLCMKHNRKNKAKLQLSAVEPLLELYGSSNLRNNLQHLVEKEGYNQHMIKHLLQEIRREEWLRKQMSIDKVFDLLQFSDDLTTDIQIGKFDELKEYILSLGREKYKNKVIEYADDKLVAILTDKFGGEGNLVKQMSKAKFSGVNDESMSGLESALFRKWHDMKTWKVWNRLQFGDDAVGALTSGKIEIADKYFTKRYKNGYFDAIQLFEEDFGTERLTAAFAIAKSVPDTKEFATMMQHKQFNNWRRKNKSAADIFKSLNFNINRIDTLLDVKLEALSSFISLLEPTKPYVKAGNLWDLARLAMNSVLGDDPARLLWYDTSLLDVLFEKWSAENLQPDKLYDQFYGGGMTVADRTDTLIVACYEDFIIDGDSMVNPSLMTPRRLLDRPFAKI
ncbi:uncharacterized protein PHALS_01226 [Plasmopara halstedii]|uniref:RxLR-like protein n=1 Tax=Plasmopara halstedii TaxID=4781 RepID=A0A0P1AVC0_PLAHL|nr:uncharacterized protein PHALS_01226 [Plasmopara halstedii]CEG44898.1 hypothetical protein PHALS_01226 [Plasmopara halstedii]|eukprot:XP_024581267.1 hypothetical protein PHALS_01226 [Plasmopara halstedii]